MARIAAMLIAGIMLMNGPAYAPAPPNVITFTMPAFEIIQQAPEPEKKIETITIRVTAYAPFDNQSGMCADENPEVTSIGKTPGTEYAAVDPARIPYGTKLNVPGYGIVEAADTGGALRSSEELAIDVYFDTYAEAISWGVQYLAVQIIEEEVQ